MNTVFAHVARSQSEINFDLDGYNGVVVVGSAMTEEGFYLILEGDEAEVDGLMIEWAEMQCLVESE